jgi:hypothetical protein
MEHIFFLVYRWNGKTIINSHTSEGIGVQTSNSNHSVRPTNFENILSVKLWFLDGWNIFYCSTINRNCPNWMHIWCNELEIIFQQIWLFSINFLVLPPTYPSCVVVLLWRLCRSWRMCFSFFFLLWRLISTILYKRWEFCFTMMLDQNSINNFLHIEKTLVT